MKDLAKESGILLCSYSGFEINPIEILGNSAYIFFSPSPQAIIKLFYFWVFLNPLWIFKNTRYGFS